MSATPVVKKAKKEPRKTGVVAMDEAFEKIRTERARVREELKNLRAAYKKELVGSPFKKISG